MVLDKIKNLLPGSKEKGRSSSPPTKRNVERISGNEDTGTDSDSPLKRRQKRENMNLPSERRLVDSSNPRVNEPRGDAGRPGPGPERSAEGQRRPLETSRNIRNDTGTQRPSPGMRNPQNNRELQTPGNSPERNQRYSRDTDEMLQEILRRLDSIDRKLEARPMR